MVAVECLLDREACQQRRAKIDGANAALFGLDPSLRPRQIKLRQSHGCNSLGKQNGLVDRLCHLAAQTFASDVVGTEMLPSVDPAQSRLLLRR
jgi:hypothetical protein